MTARCCQSAARLGLQNGDVVRALAGVPLTSPEKALEGYVRARESRAPKLTIERAGKTLDLSIDWTDLDGCRPRRRL